MVTQLSDLNPGATYSYADYLSWQFSEFVELIRGHIVKMAAPLRRHQRISGELYVKMYLHLKSQGRTCNVYAAPFDVRLVTNPAGKTDKEIYTVVQPDLCVVCDPDKLDDRGCLGAPDWIVEIISEGTAHKDRFIKRDLYEEAGVAEYWIVYPGDQFIDVFRLDEQGKYGNPTMFTREETVSPRMLPEMNLVVKEIFVE